MARTQPLAALLAAPLALLAACASAPTAPLPTDGPGPAALDVAADEGAWYAALFQPGSTARWAVVEEIRAVTAEAAERGGPESEADWESIRNEGVISCTVDKVREVGDSRISRVYGGGFTFSSMSSPIDGHWVLTPQGLYRTSDAEPSEDDLAKLEERYGLSVLPRPLALGVRTTEEEEAELTHQGAALCSGASYLLGDGGGTVICFERGAWPAHMSAAGGAAWQDVMVRFERLPEAPR